MAGENPWQESPWRGESVAGRTSWPAPPAHPPPPFLPPSCTAEKRSYQCVEGRARACSGMFVPVSVFAPISLGNLSTEWGKESCAAQSVKSFGAVETRAAEPRSSVSVDFPNSAQPTGRHAKRLPSPARLCQRLKTSRSSLSHSSASRAALKAWTCLEAHLF